MPPRLSRLGQSISRLLLTVWYLVVLVKPEEGQVGDSDGLPMVRDLLAGAVDDMRDLVGHDKLEVLQSLSPIKEVVLPRPRTRLQ